MCDVVASGGKTDAHHVKKAPIDYWDCEQNRAVPNNTVLQVWEAHIWKGQKQFFFERYTTSVNQRTCRCLGKRARSQGAVHNG